jgi:hypothetical protein
LQQATFAVPAIGRRCSCVILACVKDPEDIVAMDMGVEHTIEEQMVNGQPYGPYAHANKLDNST